MKCSDYPLLSTISNPRDLKKIPRLKLITLAQEIRKYLIEILDVSGGHFASSLGALELTVALHYSYNTPYDLLIWDVGHQTYVHKILTQRSDKLVTIKKDGGLYGFPKRAESKYDVFGTGHSSTSISAATGMSVANKLNQSNQHVIAVIGDGALTGGMSFEALNHAGGIEADMLIIFNDNDMSISENVGGLTTSLSKLLSSKAYNAFREKSKNILSSIPPAFELAKILETQTKGILSSANLFESFGFHYIGPIDGHDIDSLLNVFEVLKKHKGPKLLHIKTKKGKGYLPAESDPIKFHHVSANFNQKSFLDACISKKDTLTYSQVFGRWICDAAQRDDKLIGITPAMREGSGMVEFSKKFPDRYYDVAIAEQHAVTFAAGLACQNMKPVVAIYSTFLQRAYDQVIHDVSIQDLNVLYAVDRAGLVGEDGATHAGSFDLSFMSCVPNLIIMAPSNENECYHMLDFGYQYKGAAMVRYPRGKGTGEPITQSLSIELGKSNDIRQGDHIAILSFGTLLPLVMDAANMFNCTVIDMRFVKTIR